MLSKERESITSKSFNNKSNLESKHPSFSILSALQLYFNKLETFHIESFKKKYVSMSPNSLAHGLNVTYIHFLTASDNCGTLAISRVQKR